MGSQNILSVSNARRHRNWEQHSRQHKAIVTDCTIGHVVVHNLIELDFITIGTEISIIRSIVPVVSIMRNIHIMHLCVHHDAIHLLICEEKLHHLEKVVIASVNSRNRNPDTLVFEVGRLDFVVLHLHGEEAIRNVVVTYLMQIDAIDI